MERGQGRGGLENQADQQDRTKVRPVPRGGMRAEVWFLASWGFQSEGGGGTRGSPLAVAMLAISELQGGWISFRESGQCTGWAPDWNSRTGAVDHNRMVIYKAGAYRTAPPSTAVWHL